MNIFNLVAKSFKTKTTECYEKFIVNKHRFPPIDFWEL
jgi:hypothetical protein